MRKLATVRLITDIRPIQNADRIQCAIVDGWECVVSKADNFCVGDKIVYIEIDSIMPEKPEYEFLRSRKFRVQTLVLRGQVSQGLILPLSVLPDGEWVVGDDVTDILGVTKYDPELDAEIKASSATKKVERNAISRFLLRFKWYRNLVIKPPRSSAFPNWIKKTDEERIQNMPDLFEQLKTYNTVLSVTEKVDGTSATYFLKKEGKKFGRTQYDFGVCSRNRRLIDDNDSHFWRVVHKYEIENVLREMIGDHDYIILQGEITGKGIQGNKYPISESFNFWAFNLIVDGQKYTTSDMQRELAKHGVMTVPIVTDNFIVPNTIHELVEFVKGKSQIVEREREGCVFRNMKNNISFKCINPDFLLENEE